MIRFVSVLISALLLATALAAVDRSAAEAKVWALEQTYWHLVQDNDLQRYLALWHPQFLGRPYVSPEPQGKNHITDWIKAHTDKGESLKSYHLDTLPAQLLDNLATTTYRVTMVWADKSGKEQTATIRVIHTWLRDTDGDWKIISGMSAPANAEGH